MEFDSSYQKQGQILDYDFKEAMSLVENPKKARPRNFLQKKRTANNFGNFYNARKMYQKLFHERKTSQQQQQKCELHSEKKGQQSDKGGSQWARRKKGAGKMNQLDDLVMKEDLNFQLAVNGFIRNQQIKTKTDEMRPLTYYNNSRPIYSSLSQKRCRSFMRPTPIKDYHELVSLKDNESRISQDCLHVENLSSKTPFYFQNNQNVFLQDQGDELLDYYPSYHKSSHNNLRSQQQQDNTKSFSQISQLSKSPFTRRPTGGWGGGDQERIRPWTGVRTLNEALNRQTESNFNINTNPSVSEFEMGKEKEIEEESPLKTMQNKPLKSVYNNNRQHSPFTGSSAFLLSSEKPCQQQQFLTFSQLKQSANEALAQKMKSRLIVLKKYQKLVVLDGQQPKFLQDRNGVIYPNSYLQVGK